MGKEQVHRVAIVGAGPRGASVLERLLAHARAAGDRRSRDLRGDRDAPVRLHVDLIDPYPPGSGHVWRRGQSRLYLMNTPSLFPTLSPGELLPVRPVAGLSFDQWRVRARDEAEHQLAEHQQAGPPEAGNAEQGSGFDLCAEDAAELKNLGAADFPSRALYGAYLRWMVAELLCSAGEGVTIEVHESEVIRLVTNADGFGLELFNGEELRADSAVLAMGHLPAELRPDQQVLLTAAAKHRLRYWPPAVPADVDLSALPADEPVLIRGLGLNFFDIMIELTLGRGGRFRETGNGPGEALRYESSGREPILYAASRRSTPYRAKAVIDDKAAGGVQLRFCTVEQAGRFAAAGVLPTFDHDLWPLLHRDVLWTYYTTLARVAPASFRQEPETFLAALEDLLVFEHQPGRRPWDHRVGALIEQHLDPADRLQLQHLGRPFSGKTFAGAAEHDDAVLEYLQADARSSAAGADSPLKMAIAALNAGRAVIKQVVADGGLTDASWLGELRGWFEPFVEGLASGPPALRIEQLAALVRAGLVHFLGPDPKFAVDERVGLFSASSPWVKDSPVTAEHLLEAMMPANRVLENVSPLLSQLVQDGLVRSKMLLSFDDAPVPGSGLDVTQPPYRLRRRSGQPHAGLFALGLQLSSVQWGTAIAAEAGGSLESGARTLKDADDIAAAILQRAGR